MLPATKPQFFGLGGMEERMIGLKISFQGVAVDKRHCKNVLRTFHLSTSPACLKASNAIPDEYVWRRRKRLLSATKMTMQKIAQQLYLHHLQVQHLSVKLGTLGSQINGSVQAEVQQHFSWCMEVLVNICNSIGGILVDLWALSFFLQHASCIALLGKQCHFHIWQAANHATKRKSYKKSRNLYILIMKPFFCNWKRCKGSCCVCTKANSKSTPYSFFYS